MDSLVVGFLWPLYMEHREAYLYLSPGRRGHAKVTADEVGVEPREIGARERAVSRLVRQRHAGTTSGRSLLYRAC